MSEAEAVAPPPKIAILGAGIFVRTQYIPRLAEISHLLVLKSIWSRTQESARGAVEIARKYFPEVEAKWGDTGLDEIVDMSLKLLNAGKHVLQAISEAETGLSSYHSICIEAPGQPIWAVAENYRFEPSFVESKKLLSEIGDMMSVQVIIEGSMNSSNPYFSSSWRRNFTGGFVLDMGVHFIAGLRMLVGCEITSVSATTSHVDLTLPPPDSISSLFQLENGCSGVFVMVVIWRLVGLKGTLQVERGNEDGRHGYLVSLYGADGQSRSSFYPFSGVTEELKAFLHDISQATYKKSRYQADPRSSYVEGARDIAVLEAMLESGMKQGAPVQVKKF
ncbi:hypothetical protein RJ639_005783 [Escallonia herrerae]|uniref:GFO/IDH/MocA-like oxidoreductase domain-containing protein n=1 Tax=Escallonia herrerae TaxID=1293975 RepID=A0AA89AV44_9ASTE|nr:hypothetical protein RJ639_005783 [Escallonia herrerae]